MHKILAFAAIYLIWGSTYLAIRLGVQELPPFVLAGCRFFAAGLLLFLYARRNEAPLTRREWIETAVAGLFFFTITHGLGHWAQVRVPSGTAAVIVATVAFWLTGLDAVFVSRRAPSGASILCILCGFLGVVVLVAPWQAEAALNPAGVVALLFAPLAWATGSLWARRSSMPRCLPLSVGAQKIIGGGVLLGLATAAGDWQRVDWSGLGWPVLLLFLYLIIFGSVIAFLSYTWLLSRVEPALVGTYAFVNPLVAMFLGWMVVGEEVSSRALAALGMIVIPVAILQWREAGTRRKERNLPHILHGSDRIEEVRGARVVGTRHERHAVSPGAAADGPPGKGATAARRG